MNDTTMTRKSDPKYDDDLVNKRYVDKVLLNTIHPVGEIFTTTDLNFDPNEKWIGKWVKTTNNNNVRWNRIE